MAHRVLVIDDDAVTLEVLRHRLESDGFVVDTVENGARGLEALNARQHAVVITDIIMPGQDGIETTFAVRRARPDTKVIAISGAGRIGDPDYYLRMARAAGAFRAFAKPLELTEVTNAVHEALERP